VARHPASPADVHARRLGGNDVCVPDDLASHLDAVEEGLVEYLDANKHLSPDAVRRLQRFAIAMAEGSMTPGLAREDWPDFYPLAAAFVVVCGSDELRALYDEATLFSVVVRGEVPFTDADRVFLVLLADELEQYARTCQP
jgi:hypothetical protein